MTIATYPQQKIKIEMSVDSIGQQEATFFFRAIRFRRYLEYIELYNDLQVNPSDVQLIRKMFDAILDNIIDWDCLNRPFHPDSLADLLTNYEANQLFMMMCSKEPELDIKKKSESQSCTNTENSVTTVQDQEIASESSANSIATQSNVSAVTD